MTNIEYLAWLQSYGLVGDKPTDDDVRAATRQVQREYGLAETGEPDTRLFVAIQRLPRCGVELPPAARGQLNRWGKQHLTWSVTQYLDSVQPNEFDAVMKDVFSAWSSVCGLTFEQIKDPNANLVIGTGRGQRAGFDGPGGVLAWCQLPMGTSFAGQLQARMDLDESWIVNKVGRGIPIFQTMLHEMGHGLGLDHSSTPQQVMNPVLNVALVTPQAEDVQRVVDRYGQPIATSQPSTPNAGIPPATINKAEILLRFNGNYVCGPYDLDLTKHA